MKSLRPYEARNSIGDADRVTIIIFAYLRKSCHEIVKPEEALLIAVT